MADAQYGLTGQAQRADAVKIWADILRANVHQMDVCALGPDGFNAEINHTAFGSAVIGLSQGTAQSTRRTRRHIARSTDQHYALLYCRSHPFRIEQYGRDIWVGPGQCAFCDSKEPYLVSFPTQLDCIGIRVSQDWLERWLPFPEDDAARLLDGKSWGTALSAVVQALFDAKSEPLPLDADIVLDQVGALIALASNRKTGSSSYAGKFAERIRSDLRAQCQDAQLTPAVLAQAYGISKRYLHILLARDGTSFGEELMAARLERAAAFLRRPDFAAVSIGEIALRSGFTAPVHFARRFRARFGQSPSAFRNTVRSQFNDLSL